EVGNDGLDPVMTLPLSEDQEHRLREELRMPGPNRLRYVGDALRAGLSFDEVRELTGIDPWFLAQVKDLIEEEQRVQAHGMDALDFQRLRTLKRKGFSDRRLARLLDSDEATLRARRLELGIRPVFKRVDTCAAEFATSTAYMYSSYEEECEAQPSD